MSTASLVKCACERCICEVSLNEAIAKNGQHYCSNACATGHVNKEDGSCAKEGCGCC